MSKETANIEHFIKEDFEKSLDKAQTLNEVSENILISLIDYTKQEKITWHSIDDNLPLDEKIFEALFKYQTHQISKGELPNRNVSHYCIIGDLVFFCLCFTNMESRRVSFHICSVNLLSVTLTRINIQENELTERLSNMIRYGSISEQATSMTVKVDNFINLYSQLINTLPKEKYDKKNEFDIEKNKNII